METSRADRRRAAVGHLQRVLWGLASHPTPRAVTAPPRSGCDVALLAAPLRQGPSATGFRPAYHNARAAGWAINHEKMQCL